MRKNNRNIPWWTQDLAERRRKVRRLFNAAKKSGNWTDYKRNLTISAVSSIQLKNGEYTTTAKGTLEELLRVHFPGSEIIPEPSGGWDGLELEMRNGKDPGKIGQFPKGL